MREIKFRAWVGTSMEYSVGASKYGRFYCAPDPSDTASLSTTLYSDNVPIMQFTGLKDKHGKEIYEGDIVSIILDDDEHEHDEDCEKDCTLGEEDKKKSVVEWNAEFGGFTWDESELFGGEYILGFRSYPYIFEVIGNIYESPDFLK